MKIKDVLLVSLFVWTGFIIATCAACIVMFLVKTGGVLAWVVLVWLVLFTFCFVLIVCEIEGER